LEEGVSLRSKFREVFLLSVNLDQQVFGRARFGHFHILDLESPSGALSIVAKGIGPDAWHLDVRPGCAHCCGNFVAIEKRGRKVLSTPRNDMGRPEYEQRIFFAPLGQIQFTPRGCYKNV
jgi:hypothetical protein